MNINQAIALVLVTLGVFVASTAQLTDLVGPGATKLIVSLSSLLMSILSGVLGVLTGQSGQLKAVDAMPGVDKIVMNRQATVTQANMVVDPNSKAEAAPGAEAVIQATARSA